MGDARRRKIRAALRRADESASTVAVSTGDFAAAVAAFADNVLHGTGDAPNVALGPIVWEIEAGHDTRRWYFMVCSIDAKGELRIGRFRIAQDDRGLAERSRAALMMEIIQRRPVVMADFDDELPLARWCEDLCPSERSRSIRLAIERERAGR